MDRLDWRFGVTGIETRDFLLLGLELSSDLKLNEGEKSQGNGEHKHQASDTLFIAQVDG